MRERAGEGLTEENRYGVERQVSYKGIEYGSSEWFEFLWFVNAESPCHNNSSEPLT